MVSAGSYLAAARFETSSELVGVVLSYLPPIGGAADLESALGGVLEGIIRERARLSVVGGIVLLWVSTRLVSCLRVSLRDAFEMEAGRGILAGKLFDLQAVTVGGLLLFANVGVTVTARTLEARGILLLGMSDGAARLVQGATSQLLSFASAWLLFFLVYWRVPGRRVHFRTAAVGATFTAAVYEIMKGAFAWYATSVVDYSSAYGGLAVVAMLFFWIYYSAVVFILGGHVARTFEVRREIGSAAVRG